VDGQKSLSPIPHQKDSLLEKPHTLHPLRGLSYVALKRVVPYEDNMTSTEKAICMLPQEATEEGQQETKSSPNPGPV
jgi:hypothetical protein